MGTRGPAPKENAQRRNKHPEATEISREIQPGRELAKGLGVTTPGAKRFWKTWSTAPQSADWLETDWTELEITTILVDQLYKGDYKLAGEIRQRVAKWGATNEDRARLRMKLEKKPGEEGTSNVPPPDIEEDEELYNKLRAV